VLQSGVAQLGGTAARAFVLMVINVIANAVRRLSSVALVVSMFVRLVFTSVKPA